MPTKTIQFKIAEVWEQLWTHPLFELRKKTQKKHEMFPNKKNSIPKLYSQNVLICHNCWLSLRLCVLLEHYYLRVVFKNSVFQMTVAIRPALPRHFTFSSLLFPRETSVQLIQAIATDEKSCLNVLRKVCLKFNLYFCLYFIPRRDSKGATCLLMWGPARKELKRRAGLASSSQRTRQSW